MTELELLKKPEYIDVVLNHLPIFAQPGGRVRHPEFRPSETPTPASETDHKDK